MKKTLAFLLTLILVGSIATGALAETAEEGPWTFTVMASVTSDFGDLNNQWLMDKIEEEFNIIIEAENVSAEGFSEKKNLAFGSGQLPDFFFGTAIQATEMATYGAQGTLIPLEQYFTEEYMPNFMAQMEEYPDVYRAMFFPDGHAYAVWGFNPDATQMAQSKFWVNVDWAEEYIGKVPETVEEFYDYCVAVRDNDANGNGDPDDEYGFYGQHNSAYGGYYDGLMGLLPAFGFVDRRVQVFDGDVVLVPTHPNYKEFLKYMNRLYEEGLMNPDYFTTTEEERIAVEASKQCGSFTDWCQWGYMTDFDDWFQWQAIDPLTSEFNSTKMWPGVDVALTYNLCITNKCENVEKLLELVDWFYTDEGILAEGEGPMLGEWEEYPEYGWEFVRDETGYGEFIRHWPEDSYDTWNAWHHDVVSPWMWPVGTLSDAYTNEETRYDFEDPDDNLLANVEEHYVPYLKTAFPAARFTAEESNELALITTDLNSYLDQQITKFIIGELDIDENFDSFVEEAMAMGGTRFEEIYQTAYDRWAQN